jgi:hypothetical protein
VSQTHSEETEAALGRLMTRRQSVLATAHKMMKVDGGNLYPMDLFAIGAANRAVSLIDGFQTLVAARNMVCARALLRLQIDTALRFAACTLVEDTNEFVRAVMDSERIDRLKDREGNRLTDRYLVDKFKTEAPWLPEVYKRTSGYVHLSGAHLFSAVNRIEEEARTISWAITSRHDNFPDGSWQELVECSCECVDLFGRFLGSWVTFKETKGTA